MSVQLILKELKEVNEKFSSVKKEMAGLTASFESHKRYVEKNLKIYPVDVDKLAKGITSGLPKNDLDKDIKMISKNLEKVVSDTRQTNEKVKDVLKGALANFSILQTIKEKLNGPS